MKRRLGELLLDREDIDIGALEEAIQEQSGKASRLGEILLDRQLVGKEPLIEALSEIMRVPYLDATAFTPDATALSKIPRETALQYWAFPAALECNALVMIMAEPQDLHVINTLQFLCGQRVSPRLGFRQEILKAIETNYPVAELAHFQFCPHCGLSLKPEHTDVLRRPRRMIA
jgi:Type II secretion system (T2SS), protein E, N-terminal domain